jgi:hypothetical protein
VDAQWKAIAGICGGFAAFALTAGLISRALVGLMSGHSAAQGSAWQSEVLMTNPVFQAMHFLMVFVVVSAAFLAFAMVWSQFLHQRHKRISQPAPRTEAHTPHILNQKWEG